MSAEIIDLPVSTSCSGRTMPGLTTPELRERARLNFYTAERRQGTDPFTAFNRADAFVKDLERIAKIMDAGERGKRAFDRIAEIVRSPIEDGGAVGSVPQGLNLCAPSSSSDRGGEGPPSRAQQGLSGSALPVREPSTEQP